MLPEEKTDRRYGNPEVKFDLDAVFNTEDLPNYIDRDISPNLEKAYRAYVYNIEIEDFHSYFIGKAGILTQPSANIAP